ncbi:MAG TPA: hypothetical protein GXZ74_09530 [Tissierellia bacterium]|nr:hypothetical protein [Tissierellia bacterium]
MQQYLVTISVLVLLYELFVLFQAWRQGKKVGNTEAMKHTFIRMSTLMLIMAAILTVYQFVKLNFLQDISVYVELAFLFIIVIILATKTEGYYAKRPLYYEKGDEALILTSVRNPIDLTRVSEVKQEGDRIEVTQIGRPPRSIHMADAKVRKDVVRKLKARARENKAGK